MRHREGLVEGITEYYNGRAVGPFPCHAGSDVSGGLLSSDFESGMRRVDLYPGVYSGTGGILYDSI